MKLFLASSLDKMKDQMLAFVGDLAGKKIAYITNPADADITREGSDLWRIKADRDMLVSCGTDIVPLDLRVVQHDELRSALHSCDGIYVSGGNTYYFRELAKKSDYDGMIDNLVRKEHKFYISTSAGSCVMGSTIKYLESGREGFTTYDGFGFVDAMILPHRGSDYFKEEYEMTLPYVYANKKNIITLTDDQALAIDKNGVQIISL